jgi:hypothetical protein
MVEEKKSLVILHHNAFHPHFEATDLINKNNGKGFVFAIFEIAS